MPTTENSRSRWVRRTRESVLRYLVRESVPLSAGAIEHNLDITGWGDFGVRDDRTKREISAALQWLVTLGWAERLPEDQRYPDDPSGVLYVATRAGAEYA